jgi:hypothetical protein
MVLGFSLVVVSVKSLAIGLARLFFMPAPRGKISAAHNCSIARRWSNQRDAHQNQGRTRPIKGQDH